MLKVDLIHIVANDDCDNDDDIIFILGIIVNDFWQLLVRFRQKKNSSAHSKWVSRVIISKISNFALIREGTIFFIIRRLSGLRRLIISC